MSALKSDEVPPLSTNTMSADEDFEDVTQLFKLAQGEMRVGEMIHPETFSLFVSMSAIELMDPKMDIGCGTNRDIADVVLPEFLSDEHVIAIMDNLLACEMTWMHAHTLPQTVFSCVYHQRPHDVPRFELARFMRLQLGTMRMIQNIIQIEQVAEEEDFISWTYGFRLPPISESQAMDIWTDATEQIAKMPPPLTPRARLSRDAIKDRLRFRWLMYLVIKSFDSPRCSRVSGCMPILEELRELLARLKSTAVDESSLTEILTTVFDPSVNRHLLTNTPPRTAPVMPVSTAFKYYEQLLEEFSALWALNEVVLPRGPPPGSSTKSTVQRFSFHNALHMLSLFTSQHGLSILSRSLMKHMLFDADTLFNVPSASIVSMLLTDAGLLQDNVPEQVLAQARNLAPFAKRFLWCLCRNLGRQRRHLIKSLKTWDSAVLLAFQSDPLNGGDHVSESAGNSNAPGTSDSTNTRRGNVNSDVFCGKTSLELVTHEISARMMIQHWLLGFECNLYLPYEYAAVYFYIGYVLSSAANATASLAGASSKGVELHASRFALYLLDEARLWLCRALYSLLDAVSRGALWNCAWKRKKRRIEFSDSGLFGDDSLCYEQRFGFGRDFITGPAYVNFGTFSSLMKLQDESLLEKSNTDDIVIARLDDAAQSFITARRALERASKAAKFYEWRPVADEIRDLARVAVSNSVQISQLRKTYPVWVKAKDFGVNIQKYDVSLAFEPHRHFPVVDVTQA